MHFKIFLVTIKTRRLCGFLCFRAEIWILLKKSGLLSIVESLLFTSSTVATFLAIFTLMATGQILSPTKAFMVLSFMNILRITLSLRLGNAIPLMFELVISFRRIERFLLLSNIPLDPSEYKRSSTGKENGLPAYVHLDGQIVVRNCSPNNESKWYLNGNSGNHFANKEQMHPVYLTKDIQQFSGIKDRGVHLQVSRLTCKLTDAEHQEKYLIRDVSFQATEKCLIAITGEVGSGKSTLLAAIAGEVTKTSGDVSCSGTVAYVPQTAWVFPGSFRENVLFGEPYDEKRYTEVIEACALKEDIGRLPNGDLSFVGEHGVALSGGQRARISLARAVYVDADVYLLDDPLSAVDAKVSEHIFNECVCRLLKEKITILSTYAERSMKAATKIVVLHDGSVTETGTYRELENRGGVLESIIGVNATINEERAIAELKNEGKKTHVTSTSTSGSLDNHLEISEEEMAAGNISAALYWDYFRAGMHPLAIFAVVILFLVVQG